VPGFSLILQKLFWLLYFRFSLSWFIKDISINNHEKNNVFSGLLFGRNGGFA
jgi:hypothetical protein